MDPKAKQEFAEWWVVHGWVGYQEGGSIYQCAMDSYDAGWNAGQSEKFVDILKRCDFEVEDVVK